MKRLHKTNDEHIDNRERIKFNVFISNMQSFMAVLFNSCKVTSLLGEDLTDYLRDSDFTRLIDHRERIQFCAFISNMR